MPPRHRTPLFERIALGLLIVLVLWAPFPLGSNRGWAWGLLEAGLFVAGICWLLAWLRNEVRSTDMLRLAWPALALLGAWLAYLSLHWIPLPLGWVEVLSPQAGRLHGLVADGSVKPFDGDLDDYRALLSERARPAPKADTGNKRDERKERAEARAATAPLRKKARDAEARIAKLTSEQKKLEAKLADPGLYTPSRKGEVAAAQSTLAALKRQLQVAEAEWLVAEEALEVASV